MFDKWKYKLWKHLTKALVRDPFLKKAVITSVYERFYPLLSQSASVEQTPQPRKSEGDKGSRGEQTIENNDAVEEPKEHINYPQIVCVQGYYYSGSSVLIGFFNEFDNIRVVGFPEPLWTKTQTKGSQSECCFFLHSNFLQMLDSFYAGSLEVKDVNIKKFLRSCARAYSEHGVAGNEKLPELYGDYFKQITNELLISILDLDDYTRALMKDKEFPSAWASEDEKYNQCSFMHQKGKKQYLFYRFKDMSVNEFDKIISDYLVKFFSIIGGKEYVVYDQLLPWNYIEKVNRYLPVPIKQICVVRDPRDRFMAAFRTDVLMHREVNAFCREQKSSYEGHATRSIPERLILRFEDCVLKYDETMSKVMDFIGLKPENHVAPKSVFDPAISVTNIGMHRYFIGQEFMKAIEKELSKYCYYPEKETLSDEGYRLLKVSGNWDDVLM